MLMVSTAVCLTVFSCRDICNAKSVVHEKLIVDDERTQFLIGLNVTENGLKQRFTKCLYNLLTTKGQNSADC